MEVMILTKDFHSVTLKKDLCTGCTNCIKRCPTQAIRIREGKARIKDALCIDCGECIRVCPNHAKRAKSDKLEELQRFSYTIALPAPSLYGQVKHLHDIDYILTGLKRLGFDHVFEVAAGAELVSDATRKLMGQGKLETPVISSACPAVVRLIKVRFPNLCDHVLPLRAPMEVAARIAREEAIHARGLSDKDIGVFFITPCPAKVTEIRSPIANDRSWVDGAIAISEIYPALVEQMNRIETPEPLSGSGLIGVSWAKSGGEASALIKEKYLAADGIENVISVLEELEDDRLKELDFIELNACSGGCVGGVLTVENPYVAQARVNHLRKYLPVSTNHLNPSAPAQSLEDMFCDNPVEYTPVFPLSDNLEKAMEMMDEVDKMCALLPGLDCGSCGAPFCKALAEDIVRGEAQSSDCVFFMVERIRNSMERITPDMMRFKDNWRRGYKK